MRKAIFIDRDGVINDDTKEYYIHRIENFSLNPGVVSALKFLQGKGYLLIVVSNQGGISKGLYSKEDVDRLHQYMTEILEREGIIITDIFYCPHHDEVENCLCRKPKPLMLQKAMARYRIDPGQSFFIGDKQSDVEAGRNAGIRTILIKPNSNLEKVLERIN
ncbi:MAG: HAD family hydrolase [Bacteroidales bacterium]|nr:HAD family hydrolase [Bacteroidales bacterium]MBN2697343.1 HAD family hydrolase [Bacteroidales bacterium]